MALRQAPEDIIEYGPSTSSGGHGIWDKGRMKNNTENDEIPTFLRGEFGCWACWWRFLELKFCVGKFIFSPIRIRIFRIIEL
jgi:hypothetical protein